MAAAEEYFVGAEHLFGKESIPENVQLGLAVLQIPLFYYVLVATGSMEFFRSMVVGVGSCCRRICRRRQTGKPTRGTANPILKKLTVETQQLIASYACATGVVLIGSFYIWTTTVSVPGAFEFTNTPFVWRHYHIVLLALEMLLFLTLVGLKFKMLNMVGLNAAFGSAMLLLSCLALPGMVDSDTMVAMVQFMFLFRLTCIPISTSTSLVSIALLFSHGCLFVSLELYTVEVKWYKGGQAKEFFLALFSGIRYYDIASALVCILTHAWLQQALENRVSKIMETTGLRTEAAASESMLATFCDAHCFLDADLCFERDERSIASMLFRSGKNAGTKFVSYIKTPEDEQRFLELTQRGEDMSSSATLAQAINLGLRDGYDEQVTVELFHVLTRDGTGQPRHLIGLREYSQDTVPRSGLSHIPHPGFQQVRSGRSHSEYESDATSQTSQTGSVESDESLKGNDEAFLLFECTELEILGASKRIMQKTGVEVGDGSSFREFVAQKDEAAFLFQLVSYVTKATEEGSAQTFEMKMQMNMGNKRRGKAKWRFDIFLEGEITLAKAVLTSLKPIQKARRQRHYTPEGFLPIAEPLDAVAEMDRKPIMFGKTHTNRSQMSSSPGIRSSDTLDFGRRPPTPVTQVTPSKASSGLAAAEKLSSKPRLNL